jgi:hypothetical protein
MDACVRADQIFTLVTQKTKKGYPGRFRRFSFIEKERNNLFGFLTTPQTLFRQSALFRR